MAGPDSSSSNGVASSSSSPSAGGPAAAGESSNAWFYFVLAAAFFGLFFLTRGPSTSKPIVRDVRPVVFKLLGGGDLTMTSLQGKVVMVNFWATWCPPCVAELPELQKAAEKYRDRLAIVGVSVDQSTPEEIQAFARRYGVSFPLARVTEGLTPHFGNFSSLPTTFLVGCDGQLRSRVSGALSMSAIVSQLERLTTASGSTCRAATPAAPSEPAARPAT